MKKITFLFAFLITLAGFAQTNLEDFEGTSDFTGFDGVTATVIANPDVGSANGSAMVGQLAMGAGQVWQGASVIMQDNYLDVSDPVTNTVTVQVYSTVAFSLMVKLEEGQSGAVNSGAAADHTGSGWETLTYTFNQSLDGTGVANGEYKKVVFFPNWNTGTNGFNDPPVNVTVAIDNLTGTAGASLVADPEPASAAPVPTMPGGLVWSIYNDTNSYSGFAYSYGFGTGTDVNLDGGGGTNNAKKVNLGVAGYGEGQDNVADVSAYDFVNVNYWLSAGTKGFRLVLIHGAPGSTTETVFEIGDEPGDDAAAVTGSWQLLEIPMSIFTGKGFDPSQILQWKVAPYGDSVVNTGFLYIDNLVLTDGNTLSNGQLGLFEAKVSPNPSSTVWTISTPNNVIESVDVFNVLGRKVLSQRVNKNAAEVSVQSLASGLYLARVKTDAGVKTIKLIRE